MGTPFGLWATPSPAGQYEVSIPSLMGTPFGQLGAAPVVTDDLSQYPL